MPEACTQSLEQIKTRLLSSAKQIVSAGDRSPQNQGFHQARYQLYDLAKQTVSYDVIESIRTDAELSDTLQQVFSISCEAGISEECFIADELLRKECLTFGHIYRNYHGGIYEALMHDELSFLERQSHINMLKEKVAYIGGGALPLPAMLLAQRVGCKITVVDPHEPSCNMARLLIQRVGLDHLVEVVNQSGAEYDFSQSTVVFMANWIPEKRCIFQNLQTYHNLKYLIARSAAEESLSFVINDSVKICDVCDFGFQIKHKTAKRPDVSLISLFFEPSTNKNHCLQATQKITKKTRVVECMTELVGNTPLLKLPSEKTGLKNIDLYAKLEHLNPFGSIKDRTGLAMLKPHIQDIREMGKRVLELSSGNASRALQAVASIHGVQLETISNRIRVEEMRSMLQVQGVKISPMPADVDSSDAYAALHAVDAMAENEKEHYYYTDQYRNPNNDGTHYWNTGREILEDLEVVDYFIGSVGTAGSTVGISRRLKEKNPHLDITGVISEKDDFIPGIRHKDEIFNVGAFREDLYTRLMDVDVQTAIDGVLDLVRLYGVMGGPTSGATYWAALHFLRSIDAQLTQKKNAVFIVCDRTEMYFSWMKARRPSLFD